MPRRTSDSSDPSAAGRFARLPLPCQGTAHNPTCPTGPPQFDAMDFEILRPDLPRGRFQAVLFDFDGTLSLLREGWPRIMCGMMVEALVSTFTRETETELGVLVENFGMVLNGQPAIRQMERLVEEMHARGGSPAVPAVYLQEYDRRLLRVVNERAREIHENRSPPERWAVPGSH